MSKILAYLLSQYGYNTVALPTISFEPLFLLFRQNGHLGQVGATIDKLFKAGDAAKPEITKNLQVMDISDSLSLALNADAGLSMSKNWIKSLAGVSVKGSIATNLNDMVVIEYHSIKQDKVDLLSLDQFINKGEPQIQNFKTFSDKLFKGELFVVDTVLKSNRFSVSIIDKNALTFNAEVAVTTGIETKIVTDSYKEKKVLLEYEGEDSLVFAFKAQKILYNEPNWWEFWNKDEAYFRIRDQQGEVLMNEANFPTVQLDVKEELVQLENKDF